MSASQKAIITAHHLIWIRYDPTSPAVPFFPVKTLKSIQNGRKMFGIGGPGASTGAIRPVRPVTADSWESTESNNSFILPIWGPKDCRSEFNFWKLLKFQTQIYEPQDLKWAR